VFWTLRHNESRVSLARIRLELSLYQLFSVSYCRGLDNSDRFPLLFMLCYAWFVILWQWLMALLKHTISRVTTIQTSMKIVPKHKVPFTLTEIKWLKIILGQTLPKIKPHLLNNKCTLGHDLENINSLEGAERTKWTSLLLAIKNFSHVLTYLKHNLHFYWLPIKHYMKTFMHEWSNWFNFVINYDIVFTICSGVFKWKLNWLITAIAHTLK